MMASAVWPPGLFFMAEANTNPASQGKQRKGPFCPTRNLDRILVSRFLCFLFSPSAPHEDGTPTKNVPTARPGKGAGGSLNRKGPGEKKYE